MPVFDMTEDNFLHHPNLDVFSFGISLVAIDIIIGMEGFNFKRYLLGPSYSKMMN